LEIKRRIKIEKFVPVQWQGLKAADLKPWSEIEEVFPLDQQRTVIEAIQKDPLGGHSLFGPSGTGKSRILYCLLQEAILAGRDVFFSKMPKLVRSIRDYEFKRLPQEKWDEIIEAEDLHDRKKGNPLHIFIDEVDKINLVDEPYLKIFELFDFIYEHKESAVVSVCSNLTMGDFVNIFGEGLARRIMVVSDHVTVIGGQR
jgi:DNA replication protein DnaC